MRDFDNFAVFILSHGRSDKIPTIKSLADGGYTGQWYIVVDDEDETIDDYRVRYLDKVIVFSKSAVYDTFDHGDNFGKRNIVVYARNAIFKIARDMGLDYFLVLDDDYQLFEHKYRDGDKLRKKKATDLNRLFRAMLEFLEASNALTVCFAQGGDFIGGSKNPFLDKGLSRKAMNTFFFRTDRPVEFVGTINEDVNTYVTNGMRGELMFTYTKFSITQTTTQQNKGGLTEIYLDQGTYVKSFYSVMYCPSAVTVCVMGNKFKRLHHKVNWNRCTPMIINQRYKKGEINGQNG